MYSHAIYRAAILLAFPGSLAVVAWARITCPAPSSTAPSAVRRALIVAVTGYSRGRPGDARELPGTIRDADALQAVLCGRLGFRAEDIKVLKTPAETTNRAITQAFRDWLIKRPGGGGGIVYFHFSGHGSEVDDPADIVYGRDQTLVPSDYVSTRDGSNDIRDKDIKLLLSELSATHPDSVTLTFDSCHSGTVTRGPAVRGFSRVRAAARRKARSLSDDSAGITGGEATRLGYFVLSACRDDEVDVETTDEFGKPIGPLTYALCRAFGDQSALETCGDLFHRVTAIMREKGSTQQPQAEGQIDRAPFGVATSTRPPAFRVERGTPSGYILRAGVLLGVGRGTELDIFGTTEKDLSSDPLASAVVEEPHGVDSSLRLTSLRPGAAANDLENGQAVVRKRKFLDSPLKVSYSYRSLLGSPSTLTRLQQMDKARLIDVTPPTSSTWDVRIETLAEAFDGTVTARPAKERPDTWMVDIASPGAPSQRRAFRLFAKHDPSSPGMLVARRSDGSLLAATGRDKAWEQAFQLTDETADQVEEMLFRERRRRVLNGLEMLAPIAPFRVEVRAVPCQAERSAAGSWVWRQDMAGPGRDRPGISLPVRSKFRIVVRLDGNASAFLHLLAIDGAGDISQLYPDTGAGSVNDPIPPSREWRAIVHSSRPRDFLVWECTGPPGNGALVAIATRSPLPIGSFTSSARGIRRSPPASPLGALLGRSVLNRARESEVYSAATWFWTQTLDDDD